MNSEPSRPMLEIVDLVHQYGTSVVVDHVSLTVAAGEFLTILGESGSGKTTMLRVVAGLEQPTAVTRLAIDGEDVRDRPAAKRNCTTVFQNYALFPHMSVGENVAYGLSVRGVAAPEARKATIKALETVRLSGMEDRRLSQLSGGQRQRAALARSLVTKPAILLLDEPLGALDERLRVDMQFELVELRRQLGMTFVYITHSQEEALTMSDRIVLLRRGRIEQSGVPVDLFDRPVSRFVAEFMGFENLLAGTVQDIQGEQVALGIPGGIRMVGAWSGREPPQAGQSATLAVRAERIALSDREPQAAPDLNILLCRGSERLYRGKYLDYSVETAAGRIKVRSWNRDEPASAVTATWRAEDCVVVPA